MDIQFFEIQFFEIQFFEIQFFEIQFFEKTMKNNEKPLKNNEKTMNGLLVASFLSCTLVRPIKMTGHSWNHNLGLFWAL